MTFDVDTLVEEILSKSITPEWILPATSKYFSLEDADKYVNFGSATFGSDLNSVQILWVKMSPPYTWIKLIINSELIEILFLVPKSRLELTSLQDWQRFLENLPEFIRKGS